MFSIKSLTLWQSWYKWNKKLPTRRTTRLSLWEILLLPIQTQNWQWMHAFGGGPRIFQQTSLGKQSFSIGFISMSTRDLFLWVPTLVLLWSSPTIIRWKNMRGWTLIFLATSVRLKLEKKLMRILLISATRLSSWPKKLPKWEKEML